MVRILVHRLVALVIVLALAAGTSASAMAAPARSVDHGLHDRGLEGADRGVSACGHSLSRTPDPSHQDTRPGQGAGMGLDCLRACLGLVLPSGLPDPVRAPLPVTARFERPAQDRVVGRSPEPAHPPPRDPLRT